MKLGYAQRAAEHFASATDANNAYACGVAAVKAAVEGKSGYMVKIVRNTNGNGSIKWETGLRRIWRKLPTWNISSRAIGLKTASCRTKIRSATRVPLIEGEVKFLIEGGLPKFVTFDKTRIDKTLPAAQLTWERRRLAGKCVTSRPGANCF